MTELEKIEVGQMVPAQKTPITPMDLINRASDAGADLDKMQQLMDLQERWEAREAKKAYVISMSNFRASCPSIDRTKKAHNSKYAGLAETLEQIKGILAESGLSHSWRTKQDNKIITVTCVVTHVMGHSEETSLSSEPDASGSIKGIQGIASTVSYLERYTLYAILGLASKEMDNDGQGEIEYVSDNQLKTLQTIANNVGANLEKFCQHMRIRSLADLPSSRFNEAKQALNSKVKK